MIEAVLFDLDDTLFEQRHWLDGAWHAVAAEAAKLGLEPEPFRRSLMSIAAEGSDRGGIIDRALAQVGATDVPVASLVEAFRSWCPPRLPPMPGARLALSRLRTRVPVGLVTDGHPAIQGAKLRALGLADAFDVIVFSDELGRECRKPHPAPFLRALRQLSVEPAGCVYVGDRPDKDTVGPLQVGMRTVRVRTGEYAHAPDDPEPWMGADDVIAAIHLLHGLVEGHSSAERPHDKQRDCPY